MRIVRYCPALAPAERLVRVADDMYEVISALRLVVPERPVEANDAVMSVLLASPEGGPT